MKIPGIFCALALTSVFTFGYVAVSESETVRIGAALPLSGDFSSYGALIRGGILFAAEDLKREGINTELFLEDAPVSGAGAVSAVKKLISVDRVQGIAGNFSNLAMSSVAPILEAARIPTFHTASVDETIQSSPRYVVSTNSRINDEARRISRQMFSSNGFERVAVLYLETNFGESYRKGFVESFESLGGKITDSEKYALADIDYRVQLSRIKSSKPDAIFTAGVGPYLGRTLKQARELGITTPFFSVYESEDQSVIDSGGAAANGLRYFVAMPSDRLLDAQTEGKSKSFRQRFANLGIGHPGIFGSNAYDATMILGRALNQCKADPKCTIDQIYSTKNYVGQSGTFSIDADGASSKEFYQHEIRDGKFEEVLP